MQYQIKCTYGDSFKTYECNNLGDALKVVEHALMQGFEVEAVKTMSVSEHKLRRELESVRKEHESK